MGSALEPLQVDIRDRRLSPAEAEVWVTAVPRPGLAGAELRGRLVGPRCAYAGTVEVAYPLRPLPQSPPGMAGPTGRVVIPEPSLWDPQSPFLYLGTVELWRDGLRCDGAQFRHGLRSAALGPQGLRWNGKPLPLDGERWRPLPTPLREFPSEKLPDLFREDLTRLRRQGRNLLVVAADDGSDLLWAAADEVGMLILYQLADTAFDRRLAQSLARHPCGLGWVVPEELLAGPLLPELLRACGPYAGRLLGGAELAGPPSRPLPADIRFTLCRGELLSPGGEAHLLGRVGEPPPGRPAAN
jgi:hypothetical protein